MYKRGQLQGAWMAQSVKCQTLAQVMISQSMGLSSILVSVPTAQSLEPTLDSMSHFLSAPPLLALSLSLSLSLSQKQINIKIKHL